VLFSNRAILSQDPGIEDMARTALDLFGIAPPPHMEGKSLFQPAAPSVKREAAA
jgi:bisphosphoglycerate-independent phosphoglycerate mutase (AlkP superfamily)